MLTSKPVVGAINGYAVAGGFELALWCDLRVIEETAVMGVFCRRFGVPLIDGGTVRLTKLIGLARAMELILTGRPIQGKEALTWGLATRCVAVGTALGQAIDLASSLTKFPQECLKADRRSAYYSTFDAQSIEDALKFEYENGKGIIEKEAIHGNQLFSSCSSCLCLWLFLSTFIFGFFFTFVLLFYLFFLLAFMLFFCCVVFAFCFLSFLLIYFYFLTVYFCLFLKLISY